ncbi:hypothetical protein [Vulcanisaeta sp. JCM 16159]|uniref:hypothetical protein n=1 Tax=Vulcanisaeta sp. JCM 16159 TaxID=1295371 RepID=UPI0006D0E4F5|nr:hypothetical protein [Vulcanisaeta sp. JCM 16159]
MSVASSMALAATDLVYIVGGAMLITVGGVNMNIGKKNEPRDLGIVFLSGAIMLLIGVLFDVMSCTSPTNLPAILSSAATAVFDAILWAIGIALTVGKSNLFAMNHLLLYSGIYFLYVTVMAGLGNQILLSLALLFLALQVLTAAIAGYKLNARLQWISGLLAMIDGVLFLILGIVVSLGIPQPLGIVPPS